MHKPNRDPIDGDTAFLARLITERLWGGFDSVYGRDGMDCVGDVGEDKNATNHLLCDLGRIDAYVDILNVLIGRPFDAKEGPE